MSSLEVMLWMAVTIIGPIVLFLAITGVYRHWSTKPPDPPPQPQIVPPRAKKPFQDRSDAEAPFQVRARQIKEHEKGLTVGARAVVDMFTVFADDIQLNGRVNDFSPVMVAMHGIEVTVIREPEDQEVHVRTDDGIEFAIGTCLLRHAKRT